MAREDSPWSIACCNDNQLVWSSCVATFSFLLVHLWRFPVFYPFKLFAYFTHETFRSFAVFATCGHIDAVDIHPEEGSETSFTGGSPLAVHLLVCLLRPFLNHVHPTQGYIGTLGTGIAFIVSSLLDIPRFVCVGAVIAWLLAFVCYSDTRYMRAINVISLTAFVSLVALSCILHAFAVLEYVVLLLGVMHALFFFVDSSEGNRVHMSDRTLLATVYGKPWAVVAGSIASLLYLCAVAFGILVLGQSRRPSIQEVTSQTSCLAMLAAIAISFLAFLVQVLLCPSKADTHINASRLG
ncbi:Aste57867_24805 [Aphanomyces stellatus]|uniref:Aste57867_24805 protein n=1 Tax=Aphanomyces stellatus TaxID=120398 RepID=A0A485LRG9_9STRA|nr:hypothetical protein As57867_024727 [Aphanomyces stellatus]VFU01440.1 Aste57867_24805 [Aphanomyces stellatus]